MPLTPAQEWLVTHAGELLPDGRPRFRRVLVIMARQSGKTQLLAILALFWLFVERWPLTLCTSTTVATAKDAWQRALDLAEEVPALKRRIAQIRLANDSTFFRTDQKAKYQIAAANSKGGRGLSIDRIIMDELREHHDWISYNAAYPTMAARPFGQAWFISSMGDAESVVLNSIRETALSAVDDRLAIFEWSAPADADPQDPQMWQFANPNLGIYQDASDLASAAAAAVSRGGAELSGFMTERLCVVVPLLDPAVDPAAWLRCTEIGDLSGVRDRIALGLDVAPSQQHATLVAAGVLADGRVRIEPVQDWSGHDAVEQLRRALPEIVARVKPQTVAWAPTGPAATLLAAMKPRPGSWPPPGVTVEEIRTEQTAICMAFAEAVSAGQIVHSSDPLIDDHVKSATKLDRAGGTWLFSRKGGHVDAAYASAIAAHCARTIPFSRQKPTIRFLAQ